MTTTSLLEQEISEQPQALQRLLDSLDSIPWLDEPLEGPLWVVARGSSDNAARFLQYLAGIRLGLPCGLVTPSVITRHGVDLPYSGTVVAISQSGAGLDVLAVLDSVHRRGQRTIAITNVPDSAMAGAVPQVLLLNAGAELSVAATKTYTTSLLAAMALVEHSMTKGSRRTDLALVPDLVAEASRVCRDGTGIQRAVSVLRSAEKCVVVGRGLELSTAHEIALKITELTGILALAMSTADLMHGPIAALGPETPLITVAHPDQDLGMTDVTQSASRRGARIISIGSADERTDVHLPAPSCPSHLGPFVHVVAGQWLAMALAGDRGLPIDTPFSLSKVTRTR